MIRSALALGLIAIGLFAFHYWSLWFLDGNPEFRNFVLGPAFTAALFIGPLIAIFACVVAVSALAFYPEPPSGRTEREDHK